MYISSGVQVSLSRTNPNNPATQILSIQSVKSFILKSALNGNPSCFNLDNLSFTNTDYFLSSVAFVGDDLKFTMGGGGTNITINPTTKTGSISSNR